MKAKAHLDAIPSHILTELEDLTSDNYDNAELVALLGLCADQQVTLPSVTDEIKH